MRPGGRSGGLGRRLLHWLWPARTLDIVLFLAFGLVLVEALSYPPDARLFPMIVGTSGLILIGAILLAPTHVFEGAARSSPSEDIQHRTQGGLPRMLLAVGSAPAFSIMVWTLGFYAATFITLIGFPALLGFRRIGVLIPLACAGVAILAGVFSYAMDMNLPAGLLGDWAMNAFLYDR